MNRVDLRYDFVVAVTIASTDILASLGLKSSEVFLWRLLTSFVYIFMPLWKVKEKPLKYMSW